MLIGRNLVPIPPSLCRGLKGGNDDVGQEYYTRGSNPTLAM